MTEDLPLPEKPHHPGPRRRVVLDMKPTGGKAHRHLRHKLEGLLDAIDAHPHLLERSLYLGKDITIGGNRPPGRNPAFRDRSGGARCST